MLLNSVVVVDGWVYNVASAEDIVEGRIVNGGGGGSVAMDTAPEESNDVIWEDGMRVVVLYFIISALITFSSICKAWTCCCRAEMAPMHPYTGSLNLTFAS